MIGPSSPLAPLVSVVIPCYNLGRYLDEAVDSVLAQSFQQFEILVVDDGSTDVDTQHLLADYRKPRTQVLRSSNRGLSAARNLGIVHSHGRYVCALDADDLLAPTWLERGVSLLEADERIDFVSHWLNAFGDEQWTWQPVRSDLAMLLDRNTLNGAAIIRRTLFDAAGMFDESMRDGCEDWEFWIRVTEKGHHGVIVPEVMYQYRRRAGSMSDVMNQSDLHHRLYRELIEKHADSYRRCLPDLVLRREQTTGDIWRHIDGLREELSSLEPLLEERRREIDRARGRLAETERQLARDRELENLAEMVEKVRHLEWTAAEQRRRADWLEGVEGQRSEQVRHLSEQMHHVNAQREELLHSRSWRLTAPFRRAARWLGLS